MHVKYGARAINLKTRSLSKKVTKHLSGLHHMSYQQRLNLQIYLGLKVFMLDV